MRHAKGMAALAAVALWCIVALGFVFAEETTADQTAQVGQVTGKADVRSDDGGEWKSIAKGDRLTAKQTVRTAKGCRMELLLADGSVLRIAPRSRVKLSSLLGKGQDKTAEMVFKIEAGKVWANVAKKVKGERKFEVRTNNAVAGVRGTVFRVDVESDAATVVKVFAGAVAVSNAPLYQKAPEKSQERVQVPGPQQVTKKQWEELVAKAMQEVRVAADGKLALRAFDAKTELDDWTTWNRKLDEAIPR